MQAMKPKPPPEKAIHWWIVRYLRLMGFEVYSTAQARATKISPGIPDLLVMGQGVHVWVEVKRPKGKLSEAQETFQRLARRAGVDCLVWRSVEDARAWVVEQRGRG